MPLTLEILAEVDSWARTSGGRLPFDPDAELPPASPSGDVAARVEAAKTNSREFAEVWYKHKRLNDPSPSGYRMSLTNLLYDAGWAAEDIYAASSLFDDFHGHPDDPAERRRKAVATLAKVRSSGVSRASSAPAPEAERNGHAESAAAAGKSCGAEPPMSVIQRLLTPRIVRVVYYGLRTTGPYWLILCDGERIPLGPSREWFSRPDLVCSTIFSFTGVAIRFQRRKTFDEVAAAIWAAAEHGGDALDTDDEASIIDKLWEYAQTSDEAFLGSKLSETDLVEMRAVFARDGNPIVTDDGLRLVNLESFLRWLRGRSGGSIAPVTGRWVASLLAARGIRSKRYSFGSRAAVARVRLYALKMETKN